LPLLWCYQKCWDLLKTSQNPLLSGKEEKDRICNFIKCFHTQVFNSWGKRRNVFYEKTILLNPADM
jgi:hypothetical protein